MVEVINGVGYFDGKKCKYYEIQLDMGIDELKPAKVKLTGNVKWADSGNYLLVEAEVRWPRIVRGVLTYDYPEIRNITISNWEDDK